MIFYTVIIKNNVTDKIISSSISFTNLNAAKTVKNNLVKSHCEGNHNITVSIVWTDFTEAAFALHTIEEESVCLA